MIRTFFLSIFAMFAVFTSASAQFTASTSITADQNAVKDFGKGIVKSYFDHNCDYLYDRLSSTVKSFENGQTYTKDANLKTELCNSNPLRTDITVTYAMYTDNYNVEVWSYGEFVQKYAGIASQIGMKEGDYFFYGSQPKTKMSTQVFAASDMARFVVRKEGKTWKIISM